MDWAICQNLDTAALGRIGEECAARFLTARGHPILDRNVSVDAGEIDILARIGGERTAIEVRSTRSRGDAAWPPAHPLAAFGREKAQQVRRVARFARCSRVDLIAVRFHERGVDLQWVPRAV